MLLYRDTKKALQSQRLHTALQAKEQGDKSKKILHRVASCRILNFLIAGETPAAKLLVVDGFLERLTSLELGILGRRNGDRSTCTRVTARRRGT